MPPPSSLQAERAELLYASDIPWITSTTSLNARSAGTRARWGRETANAMKESCA